MQVAFIGHDAGHNAITHNRTWDGYIGLVVNACLGIGPSWWKATHNIHHTVVNSTDCDPDIQVTLARALLCHINCAIHLSVMSTRTSNVPQSLQYLKDCTT